MASSSAGRRIGGGNKLYLYTLTNYSTTPTFGNTPVGSFDLTRSTDIKKDGTTGRWQVQLDSLKSDSDFMTLLATYTDVTQAPIEETKFEDGGVEPGYAGNTPLLAVVVGAIDNVNPSSPSYGKRAVAVFPCVIKNDSGSEKWEYGKYVAPMFGLDGIGFGGTTAIGGTVYLPAAYFTTPATITIPYKQRYGLVSFI